MWDWVGNVTDNKPEGHGGNGNRQQTCGAEWGL